MVNLDQPKLCSGLKRYLGEWARDKQKIFQRVELDTSFSTNWGYLKAVLQLRGSVRIEAVRWKLLVIPLACIKAKYFADERHDLLSQFAAFFTENSLESLEYIKPLRELLKAAEIVVSTVAGDGFCKGERRKRLLDNVAEKAALRIMNRSTLGNVPAGSQFALKNDRS